MQKRYWRKKIDFLIFWVCTITKSFLSAFPWPKEKFRHIRVPKNLKKRTFSWLSKFKGPPRIGSVPRVPENWWWSTFSDFRFDFQQRSSQLPETHNLSLRVSSQRLIWLLHGYSPSSFVFVFLRSIERHTIDYLLKRNWPTQ